MANKPKTNTNLQSVQRQIAKSDASYAQMRKEYTRMRDIAHKRLARSQEAGYFKKGFDLPKLKEIDSAGSPAEAKARLAKEYARLSGIIERDTLRVGQLREESRQRAEKFQELGYKFVTPENEISFGNFMGMMIEAYTTEIDGAKALLYDSDLIAESYEYISERLQEEDANASEIGELFQEFLESQGYT